MLQKVRVPWYSGHICHIITLSPEWQNEVPESLMTLCEVTQWVDKIGMRILVILLLKDFISLDGAIPGVIWTLSLCFFRKLPFYSFPRKGGSRGKRRTISFLKLWANTKWNLHGDWDINLHFSSGSWLWIWTWVEITTVICSFGDLKQVT